MLYNLRHITILSDFNSDQNYCIVLPDYLRLFIVTLIPL